ncbi:MULTISPECIES: site-specific integrase [unclassified Streptomyces]|uniref:site-specific integrase n=1 Tax=unclassified Streptomyces TaxID=2593676 RepID=UPI002271C3FB|nr:MULTISPECIES: site-specific integrase [unclassified Streptomyces]MCY0923505.1 tyrosine-type recombinase/integrase [Streptomyces sp. H27-G5]MCY0961499.1 tyrosine-type recombinase/integrase [Streptomyces sp. H27-H5]
MFQGTIYKRCKCTAPKTDESGGPVLNEATGRPVLRELGSDCPRLQKREKNHGSWYYYLNLPDGPRGERRRPRKGGFLTQKKAEEAAQKLWDEADAGIDIDAKITVADYLRTWVTNRVDLKDGTREEYEADIEKVFIPALGHFMMRELRTPHIQALFADIWAFNEVKKANQVAADQARAVCKAAHADWKNTPAPRPPELRAAWDMAKADLKKALAKPRRNTGPGRQHKLLNTLSGALKDAVKKSKLITENWADGVNIPKYEAPDPLVWTDERVARWHETGETPGPVMVWTPEQTGRFLDAAVDERLYPAYHLMVFRAPRRGEAAGLPWSEIDMTRGTANIVETLVTNRDHKVRSETTKSRAGKRTVVLDGATFALLSAWRDVQRKEKIQWQAKHRKDSKKYGPYVDSGYVFTMPDGRPWHPDTISQSFTRLIKRLGLPPIRLHDLRHCAASLSLAAGLSMKAIQGLLGHASFALTANTYTSLMPQFAQAEADATVAVVPRKAAPETPTDLGGSRQVIGGPQPAPDEALRLDLAPRPIAA